MTLDTVLKFCISIHAPTRGATFQSLANSIPPIFQSTLPREERRYMLEYNASARLFQSTLPREERLHSLKCLVDHHHFNPRSHERSDVPSPRPRLIENDFNPRSHERSDIPEHLLHYLFVISIHAPTRGATLRCFIIRSLYKFQSTLPREERP